MTPGLAFGVDALSSFDFTAFVLVCGDYATFADMWLSGAFADAVICPFSETLSMPLFSLLFFGGIGVGLYLNSDGVSLPLSLFMIIGGIVMPTLPSPAVRLVVAAALLAIALAGFVAQARTRRVVP